MFNEVNIENKYTILFNKRSGIVFLRYYIPYSLYNKIIFFRFYKWMVIVGKYGLPCSRFPFLNWNKTITPQSMIVVFRQQDSDIA